MSQALVRNKTVDQVSLPSPISVILKPFETKTISNIKLDDLSILDSLIKNNKISVLVGGDAGIDDSLETNVLKIVTAPLTIVVDSVNGIDPTLPITIQNQLEANAYGAFKTIPAAVDSLPTTIKAVVTIALADGTHTVAGTNSVGKGMGDFARFTFGLPANYSFNGFGNHGKILLTSQNGLKRVAGTVAMAAVASSPNGRIITLVSTPAFADNLYRRYFMRVVSGTGAGQIKAIRNHVGTLFNLSGRWATIPDATSTIEIVEASAVVSSPTGRFMLRGSGLDESLNLTTIQWDAVDFTTPGGAPAGSFTVTGVTLMLTGGTRILRASMAVESVGHFIPVKCIIDTQGVGLSTIAAIQITRGFIRSFDADDSVIVTANAGAAAILLNGSIYQVTAFLFRVACDDCGVGIHIFKNALIADTAGGGTGSNSVGLNGDNLTIAGFKVANGARCYIQTLDLTRTDSLGWNAPTKFLLDGVSKSDTDLTGATNKFIAGVMGSILHGDPPF